MRKAFITFLLLAGLLAVQCGSGPKKEIRDTSLRSSDTGTARITFREYEHNFGKVAEGEKVSYLFTFDNKGTGNLLIASVTTSCGCTVPKYDNKPIPPAGNGNLEVVFDTSGKNGMQTKTVTIKSNASTPVVLLKISAEVLTKNN
jgi:hypothetical protein